MTKIIGNNDGPGGRNESYQIGNRKNVKRTEAVKEVEQESILERMWLKLINKNMFVITQIAQKRIM